MTSLKIAQQRYQVCGVRVGLFKRHRFMSRSVGVLNYQVFALVLSLLISWQAYRGFNPLVFVSLGTDVGCLPEDLFHPDSLIF